MKKLEIKLGEEIPFDLGDKVFVVESKKEELHAVCPVCGGRRTINYNGHVIECSYCNRPFINGVKTNEMFTWNTYSVVEKTVCGLDISNVVMSRECLNGRRRIIEWEKKNEPIVTRVHIAAQDCSSVTKLDIYGAEEYINIDPKKVDALIGEGGETLKEIVSNMHIRDHVTPIYTKKDLAEEMCIYLKNRQLKKLKEFDSKYGTDYALQHESDK